MSTNLVYHLQKTGHCLTFCRLEDELKHGYATALQLNREIEALFRQKERSAKTAPLVDRYNQLLEELNQIDHKRSRHLKPETNKSMRSAQSERQTIGLDALKKRRCQLKKLQDQSGSAQVSLRVQAPISTLEKDMKSNLLTNQQIQEISLLMASDENAEQPPIVDEGNKSPTSHQVAQQGTTDAGNPNATRVSVLSPQKQQYLLDNPEDNLGAMGRRPGSNSSSRESRRKLELEIEIEAISEIERKQQEFELRRKQREMDLELATQKEAMELAEMKRQKDLSVKMKEMEIMHQVSSRGSVSSASGSFCFRKWKTSSWVKSQDNKFDSHLEETPDDKPSFSKFVEPPCSSKQSDAK